MTARWKETKINKTMKQRDAPTTTRPRQRYHALARTRTLNTPFFHLAMQSNDMIELRGTKRSISDPIFSSFRVELTCQGGHLCLVILHFKEGDRAKGVETHRDGVQPVLQGGTPLPVEDDGIEISGTPPNCPNAPETMPARSKVPSESLVIVH